VWVIAKTTAVLAAPAEPAPVAAARPRQKDAPKPPPAETGVPISEAPGVPSRSTTA
jgi:hypothetical protein